MSSTKHATFYDEHPFDWVERYDPSEGRAYISPLLLETVERLQPGASALDVGCGAGGVLSYLGVKGHRCAGFDRSANSAHIARRGSRKPVAVADNCSLPIADGVADFVVSDGVIHHTENPLRAFSENCRILKRAGLLYLAVYKPGGRYQFLYVYLGWLIRKALSRGTTGWLVHLTALPVYFAVHWIRSAGKVSWRGARNLFYDYFASPRVEFLSRETIEEFCRGNGVSFVSYGANPGSNVHSFLIRKD